MRIKGPGRAPSDDVRPPRDAAAAPAPAPQRVRAMTINIRGLRGIPGEGFDKAQADKIVALIVRENPDVVMFQEVDRNTARGGSLDQVEYIRSRVDEATKKLGKPLSGSDTAFGASLTRLTAADGSRTGQYGNAILTRNGFTIDGGATADPARLAQDTFERDGVQRRSEARTALVSTVRTPDGRPFTVISTHLSTEGEALRGKQLQQLATIARDRRTTGPVLLGGDFNQSALTRDVGAFPRSSGMQDSFTAVGVEPGDRRRQTAVASGKLEAIARGALGFIAEVAPDALASKLDKFVGDIDRVYVSGANVAATRVVDTRDSTDHEAVIADVEL